MKRLSVRGGQSTLVQSFYHMLINNGFVAMKPAHPKTQFALKTLPDCCQHTLKPHKNKLSIGLPVGKIDSVHQTVAAISSDRGAYHVLVIGSNSWMGI